MDLCGRAALAAPVQVGLDGVEVQLLYERPGFFQLAAPVLDQFFDIRFGGVRILGFDPLLYLEQCAGVLVLHLSFGRGDSRLDRVARYSQQDGQVGFDLLPTFDVGAALRGR